MMSVMDTVGTAPSGEAGGSRPAGKAAERATGRAQAEEEVSQWSVVLMSLLAADSAAQAGASGSEAPEAGVSGMECAAVLAGTVAAPEGACAVAGATALTAAPVQPRDGTAGRQCAAGVGGVKTAGEGGEPGPFPGPVTAERGSGAGASLAAAIPVGGERTAEAAGGSGGTPGDPAGMELPAGVVNDAVAPAEAETEVEVEAGTAAVRGRGAVSAAAGRREVTATGGQTHAGVPDRGTAGTGVGDVVAAPAVPHETVTGIRPDTGGTAGITAVAGGAPGGAAPAGDGVAATVRAESAGDDQAVPASGWNQAPPEDGNGVSGEGAGEARRTREKRQGDGSGEMKGVARRDGEFAADLGAVRQASARETGDKAVAGGVEGSTAQGEPKRAGIGEIGRQIVDRARVLKYPERTEVEISLKPESLGKVVMRISMQGERLSAKFEVTEPEVRSILETRMDELRRGLAERGLEVQDLSVSVGDGAGARQYGHDARDGGHSAQRTGRAWMGRLPGGGLGAVVTKWRNLDQRALDLMA
ncbi:MAG: flagellar hook-length control protein FliK [Ignavibacteriales bacterium]